MFKSKIHPKKVKSLALLKLLLLLKIGMEIKFYKKEKLVFVYLKSQTNKKAIQYRQIFLKVGKKRKALKNNRINRIRNRIEKNLPNQARGKEEI